MTRTWQRNGTQNKGWMAAFWITGVVVFMLELSVGLDYVEARLGNLAPNFLGALPALGLAAWRLVESVFWNYAWLEAGFRVVPLVTVPFALLGLAMAMKISTSLRRQRNHE